MSSRFQTVAALALVALAAALLARHYFKKRANPGCGSNGTCGAVSPEVKKLQAKLRKG
ncbi:MAG: hypothetical protein HY302_16135 [Opitutae bacterium]|nr:hypothetical protein [Opitutae bacterium]